LVCKAYDDEADAIGISNEKKELKSNAFQA